MSEFVNLYKDAAATQQVFPRTQIEAIEGLYELIRKARPKNLLDNSDFTNPINQRGQNSYTLQGGYGIDRWLPLNASGVNNFETITANGIVFSNDNNETVYLTQRFIKNSVFNANKKYTFITYFADNTISFGGYLDTTSLEECDIVNLTFPSGSVVKYVAVYEGEYTIDTLPEYQPKSYSTELAECQRYYYRVYMPGVLNGYITSSAKRIYLDITLPSMRTTPLLTSPLPILTIRTVTGYSPVANNTAPYGTPANQSIAAYNTIGGNSMICFEFDAEIGTNNTPASAQLRTNSYLEFSADL